MMEKTIKFLSALGLVLGAMGEMLKQVNLYQQAQKVVEQAENVTEVK